jgi:phage nucleotide-binding protein
MAITSKIVSLQEDQIFWNIMVYGDSGIGKTVLAGSDDRVLFIAPEDSGTLSAKRHGSKADKWPVKNWNDLLEAYEYLYEQIEENGKLPYDWVVIDSLTEMQYMAMQHILKTVVEENASRDPDVPAIQDWQRYYIIFEKMIRAFNDLSVNVLFTALSRKVEDAEGEDFYVPDIQGKEYLLSLKVASLMTSFGHMKIVLNDQKDSEGKSTGKKIRVRRIHWEDTGTSRGKDRTRTLTPYTDNLTLKAIREKIEGYTPPVKKAPVKKAPVKAVPPKENPANTPDDAVEVSA